MGNQRIPIRLLETVQQRSFRLILLARVIGVHHKGLFVTDADATGRPEAGGHGGNAADGIPGGLPLLRVGLKVDVVHIQPAADRVVDGGQMDPSETIILTIKPDDGSTVGMEHAVAEFVKNHQDKVYTEGDIPSMKEARGKIVLIRRFKLTQNYEAWQTRAMGLDLTNWDDVSYRDYKYAYKTYDDGKNRVYIQDAYNTYDCDIYSKKWEYIAGTMKQTTGIDTSHPIDSNSWVFNYTSCANGIPLNMTRDINSDLYKDKENCIDNRFLGTVMLNFIDEPMSRLIYETNSNMIFEPKLPTPEVEVEYGQTLAEATLKGIENAPAGTWKFEDATHVVTDQEVTDQTKFELTFLPADNKKYKNVTMWVPVKTENKSEVITAYLGYEEISYGETPKMSYVVAPTETLSVDEVEELFVPVFRCGYV